MSQGLILNCQHPHPCGGQPTRPTGTVAVLLHGFRSPGTAASDSRACRRGWAIDQGRYGCSSKCQRKSLPHQANWPRRRASFRLLWCGAGFRRATISAPVAWTCLAAPRLMRRRGGISVPFAGRGVIGLPGSPFMSAVPANYHLELAGPGRVWHQDYFAVQDGIITEIEEDPRLVDLATASGEDGATAGGPSTRASTWSPADPIDDPCRTAVYGRRRALRTRSST